MQLEIRDNCKEKLIMPFVTWKESLFDCLIAVDVLWQFSESFIKIPRHNSDS